MQGYALYELALNPDIQQRLREEISNGIQENGGKLSYDLLFGFKYLDMITNESLRKYPPIPSVVRQCSKDFTLPGTNLVLEKGINVNIPVYSIQRDEEFYPQPEKFDPERFGAENVKNIKSFTFLPFGEF